MALQSLLYQFAEAQISKEYKIPIGNYQIYAKEYLGEEPAYIMLHGFPDNHIIYDSLINKLNGKRCIVFDFIGWGLSDKPSKQKYNYGIDSQEAEIRTVINYFGLNQVKLVVHDMAGPPAINYSLNNRNKIEELILLNTYYHKTETRKSPETLTLFAAPLVREFIIPFARFNPIFRGVFKLQMKSLFLNSKIRKKYVPEFLKQFTSKRPHSKTPFFRTVKQLPKDIKNNLKNLDKIKEFKKPVKIIFGARDKYLGKELAEEFQTLFTNSKLYLIDQSRHYPQLEQTEKVAEIMNK
jgi:haloalkane dehalogenase